MLKMISPAVIVTPIITCTFDRLIDPYSHEVNTTGRILADLARTMKGKETYLSEVLEQYMVVNCRMPT